MILISENQWMMPLLMPFDHICYVFLCSQTMYLNVLMYHYRQQIYAIAWIPIVLSVLLIACINISGYLVDEIGWICVSIYCIKNPSQNIISTQLNLKYFVFHTFLIFVGIFYFCRRYVPFLLTGLLYHYFYYNHYIFFNF